MEVGSGAFLNCGGDLTHALVAGGLAFNPEDERDGSSQTDGSGN